MADKNIIVVRLALHLENRQSVFIQDNDVAGTLERACEKYTHLTPFIHYNSQHKVIHHCGTSVCGSIPCPLDLTYVEFPQHFCWMEKQCMYKAREKACAAKFGSNVLLLGGDFRQVIHLVTHASRANQVNACLKNSPLWPAFKQWHLRTNMRGDQGQEEFQQFLLHIGEGTCPPIPGLPEGYVELPEFLVISTRTILCPRNEDVDEMYAIMVERIGGDCRTFLSHDHLDDSTEDSLNVPTEFLNSLTVSSLPHHYLTLAVGSSTMLIRNLDTKHGLCNGTRLIYIDLNDYVIGAKIITGSYKGGKAYIPRIKLLSAPTAFPFFSQRQFPIRLAFAMTINNSQGQTFDRIGIYLPNPVFTHGQFYVALSRAKSFESVSVLAKQSLSSFWPDNMKKEG
ncbi:hypothetical protein PR048_012579 [Dryococelus australis]|uniref:ATP-dependent DNA helicase n=1 Tax=Dryococelus australis TaxID=614101 RepID=A0ABQ9HPS6_9NEOP|nr:hypothetical protein PR048_012579 [Dryococelus australis]